MFLGCAMLATTCCYYKMLVAAIAATIVGLALYSLLFRRG